MSFLLFLLGKRKIGDGENQQEEDEDDGDGRSLAHILILEPRLPQVVEQHGAGPAGAALGQHEDVIHHLKSADEGDGGDKQRRAAQQRKGDLPQHLPAVGPVQRRRLIHVGGQILHPRQIEDHVIARVLPDAHDHDGDEGQIGIAGPVLGAAVAQALQKSVPQAVVGREEEEPDGGGADHGQDGGLEKGQSGQTNALDGAFDEQGE